MTNTPSSFVFFGAEETIEKNVNWNLSSIDLGSIVGGDTKFSNSTVTATLDNTNVLVTNVSGNGSLIINASPTNIGTLNDAETQSVQFNCSPSVSETPGYYEVIFNVNSTDDSDGDNITIGCTVSNYSVTWNQSAAAITNVRRNTTSSMNLTVTAIGDNTAVTVTETTGNGTSFMNAYPTSIGALNDEATQSVQFNCSPTDAQSAGLYQTNYTVNSTQDPTGINLTINCTVVVPNVTQFHYRWRNDDGGQNTTGGTCGNGNTTYTGLRSSNYSYISPWPEDWEWARAIKNMQVRFPGSNASAVWIVGFLDPNNGSCILEFPSNGSSFANISFFDYDKHESYLNYFDANNISVYLQVEPGLADINELIDLVLDRYGNHSSVIGFGLDWEWYNSSNVSDMNENIQMTDLQAQNFEGNITEHNSSYQMFAKHWLQGLMPPSYRGDILFIDDSQQYANLDAMTTEFTIWANAFSGNDVGFQIGYDADYSWWSAYDDPPLDLGCAVAGNISNPGQDIHIYWVDFSINSSTPEVDLFTSTRFPATWKAAEDTNITNQSKSENIRLRFSLNNSGEPAQDYNYILQVSAIGAASTCEDVLSASFTDVPSTTDGCGSAVACMSNSSYFNNQLATSNLLTAPGVSTFTPGYMVKDPSNRTNLLTINQDYFTELEYNLQFTESAIGSTTYCFRLSDPKADLENYNIVAPVTLGGDTTKHWNGTYDTTGGNGGVWPVVLNAWADWAYTDDDGGDRNFTLTTDTQCQIITSPGTTKLIDNAQGAPNAVSGVTGVDYACIIIASSNVDFSCEGYNITNNATANAAGVLINGSTSQDYTNVTIRDCPLINGYRYGAYLYNTSQDTIRNITAYNNTWFGISLSGSTNNTITTNTLQNNTQEGAHLLSSTNNTFTSNTAYNSWFGFQLESCSNNTFTNNTAYNVSQEGFTLISSSNNNTLTNNTAHNNSNGGFHLYSGSDNNTLTNNTAYNNTVFGFYVESSDNSILENNDAYYSQYGIIIGTSNNTRIEESRTYNNTNYGLYQISSNYTTLLNTNITENTIGGIRFDSNSHTNTVNTNYICSNGIDAINASSPEIIPTDNTCNSWTDWEENSHSGCTFRCTDVWQYFYGNVSGSLLLAPNAADIFYSWAWNGQNGKVYVVSINATIDWASLVALGRNTTQQNSTNDFTELDTLLGISADPDDVNESYSYDGSNPLETRNWTLFELAVDYLPISNSSVFNTFYTGIAWDSSQDGGGGQFDPADNEDVVFVTEINGTASNDYEIKVPETLATYKGGNLVEFWLELD